jgi:ribosomal protein S25
MEDRMPQLPTLTSVENGQAMSLDDLRAKGEELHARMAEECNGLRSMLDAEQQLTDQMQGIIDASHERSKRVRRALAALEGTTAAPRKETAKRNHNAAREGWTVSEKKVEEIYAALIAIGGEGRGSEIAKQAGTANETTRRALTQLREQDRVRITAQNKRLGATFAVMPDVGEDAHAA